MENLDRIKEELRKLGINSSPINEAEEKDEKGSYERIKNILSNPIWNHAEIAKQLWGDKEATNRSYFGKCLNMDTNDSGGTYQFDEAEIAKIYSVLMAAASSVTGGRKKQKRK